MHITNIVQFVLALFKLQNIHIPINSKIILLYLLYRFFFLCTAHQKYPWIYRKFHFKKKKSFRAMLHYPVPHDSMRYMKQIYYIQKKINKRILDLQNKLPRYIYCSNFVALPAFWVKMNLFYFKFFFLIFNSMQCNDENRFFSKKFIIILKAHDRQK